MSPPIFLPTTKRIFSQPLIAHSEINYVFLSIVLTWSLVIFKIPQGIKIDSHLGLIGPHNTKGCVKENFAVYENEKMKTKKRVNKRQ
jgi:hypothetical protein